MTDCSSSFVLGLLAGLLICTMVTFGHSDRQLAALCDDYGTINNADVIYLEGKKQCFVNNKILAEEEWKD